MKRKLLSFLSFDIPKDFHPIVVGKICSAHGVLGWLNIVSFTEKFDNIIDYQPWYIKLFSQWCCLYIFSWKRKKAGFRFIVKIKNICNREIAKLLSNCEIFVDVLQFPLLGSDEYYWKDILGCQVVGLSGYLFGVVIDLMETGSNDVLIVQGRNRDIIRQFFLIPFIDSVIKDVNFSYRVISVDWNPSF